MSTTVSFVIPALNAQKTLFKTIESIKRQNYPKELFEIIVVDNGSTDATREIAEREDVNLIHVTPKNRSLARNTGYRAAKNELIAFIDSDVYLDENWLSKMVSHFTHDSVVAGQGQIVPVPINKRTGFERFREKLSSWRTRNTFNTLRIVSINTPILNTAACIYRKTVLDEVGGFDEALDRHEDIDLSRRVSRRAYNFCAVADARAYVQWSGAGWLDYLQRSFEIGHTRKAFETKWKINRGFKKRFRHLMHLQIKNLNHFAKKWDFFWLQKGLVEIIVEMGSVLNKSTYEGDLKSSEVENGLSLIIFTDRVHAIHLQTNRIIELEAYHAYPLLQVLGFFSMEECQQKMKSLMGEEFSTSAIEMSIRELSELGVLKADTQ